MIQITEKWITASNLIDFLYDADTKLDIENAMDIFNRHFSCIDGVVYFHWEELGTFPDLEVSKVDDAIKYLKVVCFNKYKNIRNGKE